MEQYIQINLSWEELDSRLRIAVREELDRALIPKSPENNQPQYMTKKELAVFARMSIGLVNRLANEGVFIRHRIGGRVLFDYDQVMAAITNGAAIKYLRR